MIVGVKLSTVFIDRRLNGVWLLFCDLFLSRYSNPRPSAVRHESQVCYDSAAQSPSLQCWSPRGHVDKSSSSKILEDNFEVLGLGLSLESRVLGIGLVTQVLGKTRGHTLYQSLHFLHKRLADY